MIKVVELNKCGSNTYRDERNTKPTWQLFCDSDLNMVNVVNLLYPSTGA